MKILLIEDDKKLATNIAKQLRKGTYAVDIINSFEDAIFQIEEFSREYDCILLDINLPDGNGFDFCKQIREQKNTLPLVMMTARDGIEDKIKGLNLGADDYVTKPIDFNELLARLRAVMRRHSKDPSPILEIDNLTINPQTQIVIRNKEKINLSAREFAVLEYLARHCDEVVTRTMIMEHVWGSDFETFSNVIDVYLKNLRKKIDLPKMKKLLHTIRGSGYSLSNKR